MSLFETGPAKTSNNTNTKTSYNLYSSSVSGSSNPFSDAADPVRLYRPSSINSIYHHPGAVTTTATATATVTTTNRTPPPPASTVETSRKTSTTTTTTTTTGNMSTKSNADKQPPSAAGLLLNLDTNPQVIVKKPTQNIEYIQNICFRYLRPSQPPPPPPGDIIINEREAEVAPAHPPLIIRQIPRERALSPQPVVIREAPPVWPYSAEHPLSMLADATSPKVIEVKGKTLPAPPRKIIIERMPRVEQPKPPKIIIERWLPYEPSKVKRRVIYERSRDSSLDTERFLRPEQQQQQQPQPYQQQQQQQRPMSNFDYEAEKLRAHRNYIKSLNELEEQQRRAQSQQFQQQQQSQQQQQQPQRPYSSSIATTSGESTTSTKRSASSVCELADLVFKSIDVDNKGTITVEDTQNLLRKLNTRFGTTYNKNDIREFFLALDKNNDGLIDMHEFRDAFFRLYS